MKKIAKKLIYKLKKGGDNMAKYKCLLCGYIYDNAVESVKFEDLPDDWTCPLCGAGKDSFELVEE